MSSNKPTVFVSSTCYDLKQIRKDLEQFLNSELGFEALLSETDSFPVDPQLSTIENCKRNVDELADIFVLIVGCRYGMITDSGKSITNIEYLHAKQKNIPIYVFIDKSIISNIPVWKDNPSISFASIVDNPKLFEFADSLRSLEGIWCFPFDHASDIVTTLRSQLAYLFREGLKVRSLFKQSKLTGNLRNLSGEALDIYLTKPIGWEFRLFTVTLRDGLDDLKNRKRDLEYGISFADVKQFNSDKDFMDYILRKISQAEKLSKNITTLINEVLAIAFGSTDDDAGADLIVYNAKSIISIYGSFIDWSLDGYKIIPTPNQKEVTDCIPDVFKPTIRDIEDFIDRCISNVKIIPTVLPDSDHPITISTKLTLGSPNIKDFNEAMARLAQKNK